MIHKESQPSFSNALNDVRKRRNAAALSQEDSPAFELVAILADRYGVEFDDLIKEINGRGALAALARDLLSFPAPARRKRGGQADIPKAWHWYLYVSSCLQHGGTVAAACRDFVERDGGENERGSRAETMRKEYDRCVRRWGKRSDPVQLVDFYSSPPPS